MPPLNLDDECNNHQLSGRNTPGQAELAVGGEHDVLDEVGVTAQGAHGATVVLTLGTLNVPDNDAAVCPRVLHNIIVRIQSKTR